MSASAGRTRGSVLVVDDEPRIATVVRRLLLGDGYDVSVARSGTAALRLVREERPDLVVLDVVCRTLAGTKCVGSYGRTLPPVSSRSS